jgi:putative ABC transport system substrate-binding protein
MLSYFIRVLLKDMWRSALRHNYKNTFISIVVITVWLYACPAYPAEVIILGETKFKPVADVVEGINETLRYEKTVVSPNEVRENLYDLVKKENSKMVIALGSDAVTMALALPESVPVIYGLITNPLVTERRNITGVYMTTPLNEYLLFINKNFPTIKKIGVLCMHESRYLLKITVESPQVKFCSAKNSYEFIEKLNLFGHDVDALLLLPEKDLITSAVLNQLYLYSFKEKVPVIGISEKYVKTGSLFSLGFDTVTMGRQIGGLAEKAITAGSAVNIPQAPPDKFNLYINRKTAESMNIKVSKEIMSLSERVYP